MNCCLIPWCSSVWVLPPSLVYMVRAAGNAAIPSAASGGRRGALFVGVVVAVAVVSVLAAVFVALEGKPRSHTGRQHDQSVLPYFQAPRPCRVPYM